MILNGMPLYMSAAIPEFKEVKIRERKWARRVMYQRSRRFDVRYERFVYRLNGAFYCHPNTFEMICDNVGAFRLGEGYEYAGTF